MSLLKVTGVILLVFAAIVLLCAGVIWLERKFPSDEYDERQKLAQGRASRLGFLTGILYFGAVTVVLLQQVEGEKTIEPWLLVCIGFFLMIMVDHTYCFLTHAALPLSQKPMTSIVCYGVAGAIQVWYTVDAVEWVPLSLTGHGTGGWIHLLTGISFLYLSLMHLIQYLRSKRAGDE
nr:hypothetical protein [Oscillospiraceae bacterium]